MFRIRTLTSNDSVVDLTRMLNAAYAELGEMGLNYTAVDQSPAITAKRIAGGVCFVAEVEKEIVGTVLGMPPHPSSKCSFFAHPDVASLRQFGVDPRHRGKGIGTALVKACESWARDTGFREIALDTAISATHLVALYERLGYSQVGFVQWPGKVYESVVMKKILTE